MMSIMLYAGNRSCVAHYCRPTGQLDVTSNCVHFSFQVLPGHVSSVEDHGYLISFGIEDTRAFLPKKNVTQGITTKLIL